jgi:hypothetical protein
VLHSPETYALNVTARDRFGNPIVVPKGEGEVYEQSSDLGSPALLRLQLRTAAGQCMLSPTSFVPAAPLNVRCSEALETVTAQCDDHPAGCCASIPLLWRTLADDGSLCTCHADFRVFPAVQVRIAAASPRLTSGEP